MKRETTQAHVKSYSINVKEIDFNAIEIGDITFFRSAKDFELFDEVIFKHKDQQVKTVISYKERRSCDAESIYSIRLMEDYERSISRRYKQKYQNT